MKKQDLFDSVKFELQTYSYTGNKVFFESAMKYYEQYKALKGLKKIPILERELNVVKDEVVAQDDVISVSVDIKEVKKSMEKVIDYFVSFDGLYFSFDYAERSPVKADRLRFKRGDNRVTLCQLDLKVSKLVFTYKDSVGVYDTYYFKIVPVGGANND